MGKMFMGILGGFSGTVGTVVGSSNRKGENIIRAKSMKPRTSFTEGQVRQRTRFGRAIAFVQPLNSVLKVGLKNVAAGENSSAYHYACRKVLSEALTGTDENPTIDYSKVLISSGILSRATGAAAVMTGEQVNFSWNYNEGNGVCSSEDKAVLLVYNVSNGELSFSMGEVNRAAKAGSVPLPYSEVGDELLFYLFFQLSTDDAVVSSSQYLGSSTIS